MIASFICGLALGLTIAGAFLLLWRAEYHANKALAQSVTTDEEMRHLIAVGMMAGRVAEQEKNVHFLSDRKVIEVDAPDFPRPRGVTPAA